MNQSPQIKELTGAYWLGCLAVLTQTYLAARYLPYDALPNEAKESLAAHLLRGEGQVAAFIAASASLLALSLAKRAIKWSARWKLRWLLPLIAANGWALVFLLIFPARVNSQRQTLSHLLAAIHPSLGVDLILSIVLVGHAYSIPLFLVSQFVCLIILHAFCQPITVSPENSVTR